jgi:hypothetical protein
VVTKYFDFSYGTKFRYIRTMGSAFRKEATTVDGVRNIRTNYGQKYEEQYRLRRDQDHKKEYDDIYRKCINKINASAEQNLTETKCRKLSLQHIEQFMDDGFLIGKQHGGPLRNRRSNPVWRVNWENVCNKDK